MQFRHVHASAAAIQSTSMQRASSPAATNHGLAEQLSIEHSPTSTHLSSSSVWQCVELKVTSFGNSPDPELAGGGGCRPADAISTRVQWDLEHQRPLL